MSGAKILQVLVIRHVETLVFHLPVSNALVLHVLF